ncbi:MAG TPA: branched-chain amino acid ABC transporter permease [Euzebyales bacterium]|nr:branched-chain amino acid ABC transporter permease [Euzebyales bacterium]
MAVLLDGIAYGLQLALLAVGLTMIYGLGGVLNLAHGQFAVVTGISAAVLLDRGLGLAAALVIGVALAAVLALITDATIMRAAYRLAGEARVLLSLLLTIGLAFVLDGLLIYNYPFAQLNVRVPGPAVPVLGVPVRRGSLAASALALVALLLLIGFLRYTRQGKAVRSIIEDEEGARLCGIDPGRVRTGVFVLSGALAGLAAVAESMRSSIGATDGTELTILALIVTVVGGLGSVAGALLAGLLLGIIYTLSQVYIGAYVTFIILLLAAMVTILIRPSGLLGRGA